MSINLVRCDDIAPTLWRNGKGLVRDLLHWPDATHWQARISVADIDVDSPFSVYEGAERWFSVVEGAGVRLQLPEGWRHAVPEGAALHFRGEDAPQCELLAGPTRDLNLMCKRGAGTGEMLPALPGVAWNTAATLRALFSADAVSLLSNTDGTIELAPFTLVWAVGANTAWCIDSQAPRPRAWWMGFEAGTG